VRVNIPCITQVAYRMKEATQHLALYVRALHGAESTVCVRDYTVSSNSTVDEGLEVREDTLTATFTNGVVIRRTLEQDRLPVSADTCPECWIIYEVLECPVDQFTVAPAHMTFNSTCRETWWMTYHN
jgi:hypothetical protein